MSKIPFRVSDGLDGADQRAINIGYPDINNHTDGVNVQYFIDWNTLQHYDEKRKYKKNFAVIFNDRVYYALRDVPVDNSASAGPFNATHWQMIRNDPNWMNVSSTPPGGLLLVPGAFVSADPTYSDLDFMLPRAPQNGDTVVIKDVSSKVSTMKLIVRTTDKVFDNGRSDYQLTYPKATVWFSYDVTMNLGKGGWRINTTNPSIHQKTIGPTAQGTQLSAGDSIFRRSSAGKITMILPRYANDGDTITTTDLDFMTPTNNLTIKTHPGAPDSSIGEVGRKSQIFKTSGWGRLTYSQLRDLWEVWDGDEYERWTKIVPTTPASNITLIPSARILIAGSSGEIIFTLPQAPADGDTVELSMRNASKGVVGTLKAALGDKIHASAAMFGIPRLNDVNSFENTSEVQEIKYVSTGHGEQIKLTYMEDKKSWAIAEQSIAPFRASSVASVRNEPGLVFFANEAEVLKNSEDSPSDESAVTPLTLAKKTATESRRGIAKLATQALTNAGVDDLTIVTPKKLHERTALEDRRGIAEIATQEETNIGTDDSRIVTPKKLAGRAATEGMTGIAALVKVGGAKQGTRTAPGEGVNNFNDHAKIVTPKVLFEKTATETNLGMMFWATQTEVNGGAEGNFVVRPSTLAARTATPTRTGLARMVDMSIGEHTKNVTDSLDSNVFITPKALASRIANYEMDGITRPAKDEDVVAGTDDTKYINPLKLKYFADEVVKIEAPDSDGLRITGTVWKGLTFKVSQSNETTRGTSRIATDDETKAGVLDNVIVTPRKLSLRTATPTRTGVIRLATPAEAAGGTLDNVAITPATMGSVISDSPEWGATEVRRGSVYNGSLGNNSDAGATWQGNDVAGSTRALANYKHESYAVSPRGLNTALQHYLPIAAKAADTSKFDGMNSNQFMRTDQDTSTTGSLIVGKNSNAAWFRASKPVGVVSSGANIGWNKNNGSGRTDFMNGRGAGVGGFNFWNGNDNSDSEIIAEIDGTGKVIATGLNISGKSTISDDATFDKEVRYKTQTLDDRFVNVIGDTMTGNLKFNGTSYIEFADSGVIDGTINYMIHGTCGSNDFGYVAVGATAADAGFLEIGTQDGGNEPIYVRQRSGKTGSPSTIKNSATLLDTGGNTVFPKTTSSDRLVARNTGLDAIAWGNKAGKLSNAGNLFGEIWGNTWLSEYLTKTFDTKVDRAGDTITGSLTVKKDVIVEGSFKIKVGTKYLVIRPNPATETVEFDWE